MKVFKIVVVFIIGLSPFLTFAQNGSAVLPSIILQLLENGSAEADPGEVDPMLGLRASLDRQIDEETGEVLSVTTTSYDGSGRVETRIQQLLDDGEVRRRVISTFEYDALGRAESSTTREFNNLGIQTSILNGSFSYIPFEDNLSQVVSISSGEGGTSTSVQDFEYETLSRISVVNTTFTSELTGVITIQAVPTYVAGRIDSIVQTFTSGNTDNNVITRTLGYSGAEHTSTAIARGSSVEVVNLSFSSTTQVISSTRGSTRSPFISTTEYENGDCDATNEANRRLLGLFALSTSSGGLGRQCR